MRAAINERFGGPEVLEVRDIAEPHARAGQLRVHVAAAGLNPMDWMFIADDDLGRRLREARAAQPALARTSPSVFGHDFAGVVDEVGDGVTGFAVGDRVFGGALARAVADYAVVALDEVHRTPDGVDDLTAATLDVAARTAAAALAVIQPGVDDTVLIGGAAGGVGTFAVQLARLAGARVVGTSSEKSFEYLRGLGAEPVKYGEGLGERVRTLAREGITAATDLFGTETARLALELGVPPARVSMIAGQLPGVTTVAGFQAVPGTLERIAAWIAEGKLRVPIAATYPVERIREAVTHQASRHVRGKIVVTL
ncbi:MAG TPA: NADP-dependent oxidoreductase [Polyangiaceae bacterium]|jgi:NADPH:quinone reductase-like Zn-dependent oxidoreductase|nr:NADP-dependent oxidoreductase [Polyangiaceae bacterium]